MVDESYMTTCDVNDSFRAVADATYDWESLLDLDGQPLWINPAVERLTGFTVRECLACKAYPLELLVAEDVPMFRELIQGARFGSIGNDVEFRVNCKDGAVKWFAVSWQPLRDFDGTPTGIRMSKRDIGDREAMEEKLRRQTQHLEELADVRARRIVELEQRRLHMQKLASLGNMAATIAHEINNPLAGIKNALKLIRGRERLKPDNIELLELVDKEITRIAGLIVQMRQLCRPTISTPSLVCVAQVLAEVVAMVDSQFCAKQIRFRKTDWPARLEGELREAEFKQIMHNLLSNACEASVVGGMVEIAIEIQSGRLVVHVRDQGTGIPAEILPRIFEPFITSHYDSGRTGLGLGLSISSSLADALGGSIEVQSRPGEGCNVTVRLPLKSDLIA